MTSKQLYGENSEILNQLLKEMTETEFVAFDQLEMGSKWKYVVALKDGWMALAQMMRYPRDEAVNPNIF